MSDAEKTGKKNKTTKKASARGLGRGLSALMADVSVPSAPELRPEIETKSVASTPQSASTVSTQDAAPHATKSEALNPNSKNVQFIAINRLERNPDQPRKIFNEADMAELTNSIREKGVLQPFSKSAWSKMSSGPI